MVTDSSGNKRQASQDLSHKAVTDSPTKSCGPLRKLLHPAAYEPIGGCKPDTRNLNGFPFSKTTCILHAQLSRSCIGLAVESPNGSETSSETGRESPPRQSPALVTNMTTTWRGADFLPHLGALEVMLHCTNRSIRSPLREYPSLDPIYCVRNLELMNVLALVVKCTGSVVNSRNESRQNEHGRQPTDWTLI